MIKQFFIYKGESSSDLDRAKAAQLSESLNIDAIDNLELLTSEQAAFAFHDEKLLLHLYLDKSLTDLAFDFHDGEVGFRAARVSKSNEVVAKAIGCKPNYRPVVLDATAGMGRDSLIMAALGCNVIMNERNFAIYQLLKDALSHYKQSKDYRALPGSLDLNEADSIKAVLENESFEVIYLDPMFPERKKSALVKKEMRLFKQLAGEDNDADRLFNWAMSQPVKRVVVKRPKGAPILGSSKPSHEIKAKKFRYDVYLVG
ncbi:hypothetical protein FLL45_18885 [Aliikangiella marina]|uniref:Ribosomal RNA small subunit methyltransferase J n=1 Tax=Aliikangiella marina TaxID=1712262 RepID=A0A545T523_9GAMM|nr:class I SAM-dependent methyltransferase [Aliikangiella marina]TQV72285.1 hypothetical protein FLL45_18885 [Aliikangiella marina]